MRILLCLSILLVACEPFGRWPGQARDKTIEGSLPDVGVIDVADGGTQDVSNEQDLPADSGIVDVFTPDAAEAPDATSVRESDAGVTDAQNTFACGNAIEEPGENCDDGVTLDCVNTHNGGEGVCVALGTCSEGFTISGNDCVLQEERFTIDIFVSNFCELSTSPEEFSIPAGQTAYFTWRNRSVDYPVDVWKSYGGGFLDLPTGQNWEEGFAHCSGPNPSEQFADIDAGGCASFRFLIHCL